MRIFLVKPDLMHFEQFQEMMKEWHESKTQINPWFLSLPSDTLEDFEKLIQNLDQCERGNQDLKFASSSSFFVMDEKDNLIGAASLRHYLTISSLNSWGHIGYGVRPNQRNHGYGTQILKSALKEAKKLKIHKVLVSAYTTNIYSCQIIESCGGILENTVPDPEDPNKLINRYWIKNPRP